MALATLSVDLVAKVASFEADLKRVARTSEQQGERMAAAFGLAKSALGGLVAGLTVGASVAFFRNIVDGVDALNDLSDATGSSVENLSALEDVAARTGTSFDTVGSALVKLNQTLANAKPGSDQAAAFEALGLSAKELKALDPAEALRRTAVALAGFADDGNKARLTQELFGKSLREVAPLLKDLAESGELNARVTTEQAKAAEAFNIQIFQLQKNALDAARVLSDTLVPSLNGVFSALANIGKLRDLGFTGAVAEVLKGNVFRDAGDGVIFYTKQLETLQKQRNAIASDPNPVSRRGGLIDVDGEIAKVKGLQEFYRSVFAATAKEVGQNDPTELARRGRGAKPSAPVIGGGKPPGSTAPSASPRSVDPLIDPATADALAALQGTDVAKIEKINATLDKLFQIRGSGEGGGPELDEAVQRLRDELQKLDPAAVSAAKSQEALNALLAATPSAQMASLAQQASILAIELAKATDPERIQQLNEAITQTGEKMRGLNAEVKPALDELGVFAEQAARNIQDALGDTLESALKGNFESIGDLWKSLLIKMAAQAAASQLNNFLFGSLGGGTGTGAGFVGSLFGLSGARADGGPVSAGGAYLVGERGPEIMVPRTSGTVLPNGVGMGGVTINQTINVGQGVSRGEVFAAAMQAKDAAKAEIMQTLYRTGRGAYA